MSEPVNLGSYSNRFQFFYSIHTVSRFHDRSNALGDYFDCSWRCCNKFEQARETYPPQTYSPGDLKRMFDKSNIEITGDVAALGGVEFEYATVSNPRSTTVRPSILGSHESRRIRKYASMVDFRQGRLNMDLSNAWDVYSALIGRTMQIVYACACPLSDVYGYRENATTG